ncbi:hypothetical protein RBE51_21430 [Pseudomonas taiwanensis]|uniref:hypothetical protein n=1 Tax=Pseudomonas taiwanensis TaxID=470150 RepID=UPI0028DE5183|nr:hypothetical protein [Pseudomonas taiwanensis]MDT8925361.1 hypothetical protein [Pseudomonas taiwanensis]
MATGKQIYSKIEERVNQLDRAKSSIEAELRRNQHAQQANEAKRLECMSTIATIHVEALLDKTKNPVRAVTSEVDSLVSRRDQAYQDVLLQMDRSRTALRLSDVAVDQAQADFEAMRIRVYEELARSGDFREKRRMMDEANACVDTCVQVAAEIHKETAEKLVAYQADPLFRYLLARRYGNTDYLGKGLFRRLDGWVSKKIDYTQAKHDFDVLTQLPGLADAKVVEARLAVARATDNYRIIEQQVRHQHRYDEMEKAVTQAKAKREDCRKQIAEHQKAIDDFQSKEDSIMGQITRKVRDTMAQFSFATLDRLTKDTGSSADDLALRQYQQLNDEAPILAAQEREIQGRLQQAAQDFKKTKALRDSYASNGYDSSRREFPGSFDIDRLMAGYLVGHYSLDDFERTCASNSSVVQQTQSYQSNSSSISSSSGTRSDNNFTVSDSISSGGGSISTSDSF